MHYQISCFINGLARAIGFKSISSQFTLVFGLIAGVSIAVIVSLNMALILLSSTSETIDAAARQRMLSQRLAKEAFMVAQGLESSVSMQKTIDLVETTHRNLIQGNKSLSILAQDNQQVLVHLQRFNELWLGYKNAVFEYVDTKDSVTLANINRQSAAVLTAMNGVVPLVAKNMQDKITQYLNIAYWMAIATLVLALVTRLFAVHWLMSKIDILREQFRVAAKGDFSKKMDYDCSDNELSEIFINYNCMQS
nr:type IV pili methyl-accepting chemotaxis transducer N-terminal domain-containing protein [Cellvibrionaceae bacterium]